MSSDQERAQATVADRKRRFERDLLRSKFATPGGLDANTTALAEQALAEFDRLATVAATIGEQDGVETADVQDEARSLARMRAYLLPIAEVRQEASDLVTTMEDWGVPRDVLERLRSAVERLPRMTDPEARALLRTIYWDSDYWTEFVDWLFELRHRAVYIIVPIAAAAGVTALALLLNGHMLSGFALAAVAGAGTSLVRRLPPLAVYRRVADFWPRAAARWFTGVAAAFVALGVMQAGVVTIPLPRGGDLISVFSACSVACSSTQALVLLASGFTLGFTERILPAVGDSLLGSMAPRGKLRSGGRDAEGFPGGGPQQA